ncbi:MAG: hypothetical protein P4L66_08860 [Acetobacteraceae bacterium]|nr:hypothetical protein [Acetobacteraceae bacterium]
MILFIVGGVEPSWVSGHKRLALFSASDYHLLASIVKKADRLVVTPHILTETSNLLGKPGNPFNQDYFLKFAELVTNAELVDEHHVPGSEIVQSNEFSYLGLTDAGLMNLEPQGLTVLSCDSLLVTACLWNGLQAKNFNQLRKIA